ncbi:MAG: DUF4956 domain-containing protein [SAR324 cluster bacterium]|nr:DUF4956 domain-containing protein [SAR324 cluster bacterium]MBF0349782.1 DUF4956 domain-containing protein [SAR324 cluster bacterium]
MSDFVFKELFYFEVPQISAGMFQSVSIALVLGIMLSILIRLVEQKRNQIKTLKKREYEAMINIQQTHIILCVSGAFIMILINKSLANALGLVGALSIIRFRTELISPIEGSQIIVMLTIGMACGLQLYSLAFFMAVTIGLLLVIMMTFSVKAINEFNKQKDLVKQEGLMKEPVEEM